MKKLTFLKLTLLVLYVMVGLNILLKADVETLMQIAEEQAVILQKNNPDICLYWNSINISLLYHSSKRTSR